MPDGSTASPSSTSAGARLQFGRFELQPAERRLLADGQVAVLGGRAFDLLAALASRPGRLISKSELLDLVWPGLVVEESNLHTQMSSLRRVLGNDVIATVPGRGYRFAAAAPASPAAAAAPSQPDVLPIVPGRLFGRDEDLARLISSLETPGCVTLVGAGGVGKTRLALAATSGWAGQRHWVALDALTDGTQVEGALARALGLPLADGDVGTRLIGALAGEQVLVALDNAEHVVDGVAALTKQLLAGLPRLRLLVTSQLPLALPGERLQRIEPLPTEGDGSRGEGALALLIDRIASADHRVRIEADALPLLREIVRQLDGLPLALEMAAARVPLLGLKGVRDELLQRFALLTTGHRQAAARHRTLHAALDWSHGLLDSEERRLFAALAVFAGGFTLELCVALAADHATSRWAVIDRLAALVDRSLVAVGGADPPRYRLLETMRAYALEQLAAANAEVDFRRRHAEVMLDHVRAHAGSEEGKALCLAEIDNIRGAIAWSSANALPTAVALTPYAARVTTFSPWRAQSHAWMLALEPRMRAAEGEALDMGLRVDWWNDFARSSIVNLSAQAGEVARHARALARCHDDPKAQLLATIAVVRSLREPGPELEEARADLERLSAAIPDAPARLRLATIGALAFAAGARNDLDGLLAARLTEAAIAREAGLHGAEETAETNVTAALSRLGRYEEALERSRALVQRIASTSPNLPWAWEGVIEMLIALGRVDEAIAELPDALAACRSFDLPIGAPLLCAISNAQQRHALSAQLAGFTLQAFEQRSMALYGSALRTVEHATTVAGTVLGPTRFDALRADGRRLDEDGALALLRCRVDDTTSVRAETDRLL